MGTNGAQAPRIDWTQCPKGVAPGNYECATVKVPLSYEDPDGRKIELALGRLPATDPERKIGTLFFNPGGPGGSGRIPPAFSPELRERFDIVGFDPRGTNASTPVKCFTSNQQALRTFGRPFPVTRAQEESFFAANARGTTLCDRNTGPILSNMSTANVARDMDLLRQATGDEKLSYIGYSYGTHLGEVYANLFPGKVRAMTLDAVLDPVEWTTGETLGDGLTKPFTYRLGSFDGAQKSLGSFFKACSADSGRCAFASSGESPQQLGSKYDTLLDRLMQGPIQITVPGGQTRKVTYQDFVGLNLSLLYSAQNSPVLAQSLQQLYEASQPATQRSKTLPEVDLPDVPTQPTLERPESRQQPPEQFYLGLEWFNAVGSLDTANPSNENLWTAFSRLADFDAPGFGSLWTYNSMPAATWPVEDENRYSGPWDRQTANPILTIGNRQGDPATPYDDARTTTTDRLADARLLTLDSFGHTAAFGGQSQCIDDTVESYLIQGKLPPKGKVCKPDRQPFDPIPAPREERPPSVPPVPPEPPRLG